MVLYIPTQTRHSTRAWNVRITRHLLSVPTGTWHGWHKMKALELELLLLFRTVNVPLQSKEKTCQCVDIENRGETVVFFKTPLKNHQGRELIEFQRK